MQIKAFSAKTGLSTDTLRYYEKEGLLMPERDSNGYRCYGNRDAEWVGFILRLKEMGVPLAQIKEYARLRHMGDATIPQRYEILLAHRENLIRKQQELAEHQAFLAQKLAVYRSAMQKSADKCADDI
ncbi:MerR family transcriptional regulator [Exercitatus varius]|uniref:MerR family transcriptional regulator n=1 Tax=Exercitatus varius TaxID=67857 RepID=UPI0018A603A4|nr:MerR family transcriptional regulator [Exercitatus varius]MDG2958186.1 MerR family transcriptional regulator [Exercitatus varius]QOF67884.1 MerR family transcriptional regulator [Actinobacillus sp. GY-402]